MGDMNPRGKNNQAFGLKPGIMGQERAGIGCELNGQTSNLRYTGLIH